jgi:hypothetical protein
MAHAGKDPPAGSIRHQASDAALRVGGQAHTRRCSGLCNCSPIRTVSAVPRSGSTCRKATKWARKRPLVLSKPSPEGGWRQSPNRRRPHSCSSTASARQRGGLQIERSLLESARRQPWCRASCCCRRCRSFSGRPSKHLAPALVEDVTISLCRLKSSVIAPHTAWQLDPFGALKKCGRMRSTMP